METELAAGDVGGPSCHDRGISQSRGYPVNTPNRIESPLLGRPKRVPLFSALQRTHSSSRMVSWQPRIFPTITDHARSHNHPAFLQAVLPVSMSLDSGFLCLLVDDSELAGGGRARCAKNFPYMPGPKRAKSSSPRQVFCTRMVFLVPLQATSCPTVRRIQPPPPPPLKPQGRRSPSSKPGGAFDKVCQSG